MSRVRRQECSDNISFNDDVAKEKADGREKRKE